MSQEELLSKELEKQKTNCNNITEELIKILNRISAKYWKEQEIKTGVADAINKIRQEDRLH